MEFTNKLLLFLLFDQAGLAVLVESLNISVYRVNNVE